MTPAQFAAILATTYAYKLDPNYENMNPSKAACMHHNVSLEWAPVFSELSLDKNFHSLTKWIRHQTSLQETIVKHINKHKDCLQVGDLVVGRPLVSDHTLTYFGGIREIISFRTAPNGWIFASLSHSNAEYHIDTMRLARDKP